MGNKIKEHILFLLSNIDALFELQKQKKAEGEVLLIKIAKAKADIEDKNVLNHIDEYRVINSYVLLVIEDMKTKIAEIVTFYSFIKTTGEDLGFEEEVIGRLESFSMATNYFFAFRNGKVEHKDVDFVEKLTSSVKKNTSGNKELFLENFKKSKLYEEHSSEAVDKAV